MAEWFEPKRYGYGAGLPISWQGWAIMILYVALIVGSALLFVRLKPMLFFAIVVPSTIALLVVAAKATRGGWRWRWGGEA